MCPSVWAPQTNSLNILKINRITRYEELTRMVRRGKKLRRHFLKRRYHEKTATRESEKKRDSSGQGKHLVIETTNYLLPYLLKTTTSGE